MHPAAALWPAFPNHCHWVNVRERLAMNRRRVLVVLASLIVVLVFVWGVAHLIYHAPLLHSETSTFSMAERDADERYTEWCNEVTHYITPRLCAYYQLHPERFKSTGQGEEIAIDGFVEG
jgi:hypothetical protein